MYTCRFSETHDLLTQDISFPHAGTDVNLRHRILRVIHCRDFLSTDDLSVEMSAAIPFVE